VFVRGLGLAFALAPAVDSRHSPDRLATPFFVMITVVAAFGVALLFFQRSKQNAAAFRFLGAPTVAYVILGICAPVAGVLPLNDRAYRYVFALSVGGLVAVLTTVALVTVASLRGQRKGGEDDKKNTLAKMQEEARQKRLRQRGEAGDG
jgi:hypothetical protein